MRLFKCQTIEQFKIQQFLVKEGLQPDAVKEAVLLNSRAVRIMDSEGSQMIVRRPDAGRYEFEYLIHGVKSTETRCDYEELAYSVNEGAESE